MSDSSEDESRKLKRKAVAAMLLVDFLDEDKERWWKRGKIRAWLKEETS